jgi:hypothetical protein
MANKLIPPTSRSTGTVSWHNGAGIEIDSLIESLRRSAKLLTGNLSRTEDAKTAWDGAPVVVLYRQAAELSMKSDEDGGCTGCDSGASCLKRQAMRKHLRPG